MMTSLRDLLTMMRPWTLVMLAGSLGVFGCDAGGHSASQGGAGGDGGASGAGGAGTSNGSASNGPGGPASTSGSNASSSSGGGNHPMAPNGYYVEGKTIYDAMDK